MQTPHVKAYKYISRYTLNGEVCEATWIMAMTAKAPSIESYIEQLNGINAAQFQLVEELPVREAIFKRGTAGGMIATDWRLLDNMPYHSVQVDNKVLHGLAN